MSKNLIEEALLDAQALKESLAKNSKEILESTMKRDIDDIIKENLTEEDSDEFEEVDVEEEEKDELNEPEDSEESEVEDSDEMESEGDEEESSENEVEDETSSDEVEMSSELETPSIEDEVLVGEPSTIDSLESAEELDLTNAPDEEVIKVFKKMSDDDQIEVVKDGKNVSLKDNDTGAEYHIQLEESDEPVYEIEFDVEDEDESMEDDSEDFEEIDFSNDSEDEMELDEDRIRYDKMSRYTAKNRNPKDQIEESKKLSEKILQLESENKTLKDQNLEYEKKQGEYKNALKVLRNKINEVALYNTNLTYVTKLFTEHSTTKDEKANILKRFDESANLEQSASLYKVIKEELKNRTPINESVDKKINKNVSAGSVIKESTAYVDPEIKKMRDLMLKLDQK